MRKIAVWCSRIPLHRDFVRVGTGSGMAPPNYKSGGTLIYYQPQVDDWNHFEQLGRAIRPSIPATEFFRRLGWRHAVAANVRPGRNQ